MALVVIIGSSIEAGLTMPYIDGVHVRNVNTCPKTRKTRCTGTCNFSRSATHGFDNDSLINLMSEVRVSLLYRFGLEKYLEFQNK